MELLQCGFRGSDTGCWQFAFGQGESCPTSSCFYGQGGSFLGSWTDLVYSCKSPFDSCQWGESLGLPGFSRKAQNWDCYMNRSNPKRLAAYSVVYLKHHEECTEHVCGLDLALRSLFLTSGLVCTGDQHYWPRACSPQNIMWIKMLKFHSCFISSYPAFITPTFGRRSVYLSWVIVSRYRLEGLGHCFLLTYWENQVRHSAQWWL